MKHITIKDVAKELQLSISTVSRAFNDKYDIKKETRDIVLAKAKEMGYRPNPIARKLIQQRSLNIGVIVPEFINSFFPEVIIGAQEILHAQGYQVLIMQSNESSEVELKNIETMVDNMVDGIIISVASECHNKEAYEKLVASNMPVVFFNRVLEGLPTSKVLFDDYKWAFFATEHLIRQGYTNIVHACGPEDLELTQNRIQGFNDAHHKHKLTLGKIESCGFFMSDGERLAESMIKSNSIPKAIFASSDHCAIGIMKTFKKHGIQIPNDVAVTGFSESKLAELVEPSLTSVQQPTYDMGRTAAQLLLEQINSTGLFVPQTIVLNGKLNIRDSSMVI